MTLIIPKPKPLYAPMLATFGGGSARGFGRNLPSGGVEFTLTGRVYQSSPEETLRYNVSAGVGGNNEEAKTTNMRTQSSFPSTIMDIAWSVDNPTIQRLVAVDHSGNSLNTIVKDFTSSTSVVNTSHSYLTSMRGMMMLRNGVFVTFNSSQNRCATWKMNTDGTFTNYDDYSHNTALGNVQCIINPNDGAGIGDTTYIIAAPSAGNRFNALEIEGDGTITLKANHTDTSSNNKQIWMSPMKSTDADKLRFMAFFAGNNTKVFDYSISNNTFTGVAASSSALTISANGIVTGATPAWGGYTWAAFSDEDNNGVYRVGKFLQNANPDSFLTSTTYVGRHVTAILALEDGSTASGANGHVYWGVYNSGSSPERRLMGANDNDGTGFSGSERSNARLHNGNGYTNGGCVIGERPRYAEMDAKLESTNW